MRIATFLSAQSFTIIICMPDVAHAGGCDKKTVIDDDQHSFICLPELRILYPLCCMLLLLLLLLLLMMMMLMLMMLGMRPSCQHRIYASMDVAMRAMVILYCLL